MNYLKVLLIIFILLYLLLFFQSKLEHFEVDETQCLDESTKKVRPTTDDEKKEISSKKDKNKQEALKSKKEVFLIYDKFNYLEAKEICKNYSGRLATENDLLKAFKNGANWCSWGWLEGEKIAYPVQEKFWTKTEKVHKGFCGPTAGINKIENVDPFKRFGINCYGIKPRRTLKDKKIEKELNEMDKVEPLSKLIRECKKEKQIEKQKKWIQDKKKKVKILSFNDIKWSFLQNNNTQSYNK